MPVKSLASTGPDDGPAVFDDVTRPTSKVIKFSHVSKRFILHHERPRSFQDLVVNLFGLRSPSRRGVALPTPAREEFWALRDVNFSIYAGEAVGIIGENGSGKSTSLKLISRILEPTEGGVSVRGKVSALLELGTGFHPELTGRENIFLNGSLLGLSRREMSDRYQKIVDFSELDEFIDTPIKHYSSGMVMRLGFAVAVHVDPDILLTDEVLAVGDEAFQRKCLDYIADLRRRGVTILFVSHALEAVRALCKRVIWLDHGRLIADGPSGEVIDRYLAYENTKHADRLNGTANAILPSPAQFTRRESDESDIPVAVSEEPPARSSTTAAPSRPKAEIVSVSFLDDHGVETETFLTGKSMTVRISYHAAQRVEHPVVGLAIYTAMGVHLNGPNTRFGGLEIPWIDGDGYVDYIIEELPLLAGRYTVTVAMTGSELVEVLDHKHQFASFTVQPTPGLSERWGLLLLKSRWAHHASPEAELLAARTDLMESGSLTKGP